MGFENLPEGWNALPLGEVSTNWDRKRIPLSTMQRQQRKGVFRYFGAQGVIDYVDDFIFDGEYVLIAEDGENLRSRKEPIAYLVKGKFWVNNHAHIIQNNDKSNLRFLYYAINHQDVGGYLTGTAQPKLNQANLNAIKLPMPPLPQQQKIASILGALDDKIELNNQMNQTLEAMAKALFKSWFVDFEPFQDGEFEESELGMIPKGWRVGALDAIATLNTKSIKPQEGETYNHYSLPQFDSKKYPEIVDGSTIKSNKTLIQNSGSILLSKLNPQFKRLWIDLEINNACLNIASTEFMNYVPKSQKQRGFLYCLLDSESFQDILKSNATGSTGSRQRVKPKETLDYRVLIPAEAIIDDFSKATDPILSSLVENIKQAEQLKALRDSLLPKLMNGELDAIQ